MKRLLRSISIPLILQLALMVRGAGADGPDWLEVTVVRVIDGDTLLISHRDLATHGEERTRLRLLGLDAPELNSTNHTSGDGHVLEPETSFDNTKGKEALDFVASLVRPNDRVRVEFDERRKDKYDRMLGYVYLGDGRMLNLLILQEGYAALSLSMKYDLKHREALLQAARRGKHD